MRGQLLAETNIRNVHGLIAERATEVVFPPMLGRPGAAAPGAARLGRVWSAPGVSRTTRNLRTARTALPARQRHDPAPRARAPHGARARER